MSLADATPMFQIKYYDVKRHRHLTKVVGDEQTALQHVRALQQDGMAITSLIEMTVRYIAIPAEETKC